MINKRNSYWNKFYKTKKIKEKINFPSQFSIFTLSYDLNKNILIEFGCGNGRDAFHMSNHYKKIIAYDLSKSAIFDNIRKFRNIKNVNFNITDVTKDFDTRYLKKLKKTIYARFFIHSLKNDEIKIFIKLLSRILNKNEKVFLEYRTHLDKKKKKVFKKHFRNYLNPKKIIRFFTKEKFVNIYSKSSCGFAIFNEEDPHVARQIYKKI